MGEAILNLLARGVFALRGWSFEPLPRDWVAKQVIIGFPHSTWMDTTMAFAGFALVRQKGHIIVKREAFRWPFGGLLRWLGGVPVDRGAKSGIVGQMAAEFARRDVFQLALVPEGTRGGATTLKTGFWYIARAAGVPIVCWYLDNQGKRTRWVGRLVPSDDLGADLQRIKAIYAAAGHRIDAIGEA